jgi:acetyl esterase
MREGSGTMTTMSYYRTVPERVQVPLDPEVATFLAAGAGAPPVETVPITELRANVVRQSAARPKLDEPVAAIEDRAVPGPHGAIPIRLFTPPGTGPFPVLLYLHGGGWVMCSVETHTDLCRSLCGRSGAIVVSVDYRLAPEHKFPVALDECYAALDWIALSAADIGGDAARLAVGGDSAGGNLTAALALRVRDTSGPSLAMQVLLYPALDCAFDTASYHENAEGFGLNRSEMMFFWEQYLADPCDADNPWASPLRAPDLRGLPPALIQTADYDPLRDEGEAYAARLARAGVPVQVTRYLGMNHGFTGRAGVITRGRDGLDEIAAALRAAWGTEGNGTAYVEQPAPAMPSPLASRVP